MRKVWDPDAKQRFLAFSLYFAQIPDLRTLPLILIPYILLP